MENGWGYTWVGATLPLWPAPPSSGPSAFIEGPASLTLLYYAKVSTLLLKPPPNLPTICSFISSLLFFLSTLPFFQCPRLQVVHHFLLMILRALSKIRLFHKSGWDSCKLMMMTLMVGHPQGGGLTILPKWRYLLLGDLINGCQKCLRSHQIWLKLIILHQFSLSAKVRGSITTMSFEILTYLRRRLVLAIFFTMKWLSVRKIWKKRSREICFFTLWPSYPSSAAILVAYKKWNFHISLPPSWLCGYHYSRPGLTEEFPHMPDMPNVKTG